MPKAHRLGSRCRLGDQPLVGGGPELGTAAGGDLLQGVVEGRVVSLHIGGNMYLLDEHLPAQHPKHVQHVG